MSRIETQTPIISSSVSVPTPLTVLGTTPVSYSSVTSLTTSHATSVIPTISPITSNWSPTSTIVTAFHTSSTAFKSSPETSSILLGISTSENTPFSIRWSSKSDATVRTVSSSIKLGSIKASTTSVTHLRAASDKRSTTRGITATVSTLAIPLDASSKVTIVPKVIEVSPTSRPTEPGVNPTSFEPIVSKCRQSKT